MPIRLITRARRRWPRRHTALVTATALCAVLAPAAPASAGLLDPPEPGAGSWFDSVVSVIDEMTGGEVPTGWLYDGTQTTMDEVRFAIGAPVLWAQGYTGRGVGVALIDTGVVPVDGLTSGNVVEGADLSFESQVAELRHLDTFGHGTHLAGIIAGRPTGEGHDLHEFRGVAPDARLTSLKLAALDGAVDVSQVVAAVDWVVEHRDDDPDHPIRVLNLSYGTDGIQDYQVDPLTHAVENAWRAGIVVVVSAGNDGQGAPKLNNPAYDPFVIAVGSSDTRGTPLTFDDVVPAFSSRGDAARRVDVTAPGRSVVSLRDPGSTVDEAYPDARVGDRFFKGSGTSQSAAVVSGAVALLLQQRPSMTPDQVKELLRRTASPMPLADRAGRGAGQLNVAVASVTPAPRARQRFRPSTGTGSLELARGSSHVADAGVVLTGEADIHGPWHASTWAAASSAGTAWDGGRWNGRAWTGDCWCATTWSGTSWEGRTWAGRTWAGRTWAGRTWAGRTWAGRTWAGDLWEGRTWAGRTWAGDDWN